MFNFGLRFIVQFEPIGEPKGDEDCIAVFFVCEDCRQVLVRDNESPRPTWKRLREFTSICNRHRRIMINYLMQR